MDLSRRVIAVLWIALAATFPAVAAKEQVQFGMPILVEAGETIGDAVCFGCSITVHGTVEGDLVVMGGQAIVEGRVTGDAVVIGGRMTLREQARVDGDAVAMGGLDRAPGAVIGGEVVAMPVAGIIAAFVLAGLLVSLFLVLVFYAIAGRTRVETIALAWRLRPGMSLLAGLGVMVASVVLGMLFQTMGPLAPVMGFLAGLAFLVAWVGGATGLCYWVGRLVVREAGPVPALLAGLLLMLAAHLVPVLGWVLFPVTVAAALGCATISGLGVSPYWIGEATPVHPQASAAPRP
jgi:hypothetical protein